MGKENYDEIKRIIPNVTNVLTSSSMNIVTITKIYNHLTLLSKRDELDTETLYLMFSQKPTKLSMKVKKNGVGKPYVIKLPFDWRVKLEEYLQDKIFELILTDRDEEVDGDIYLVSC